MRRLKVLCICRWCASLRLIPPELRFLWLDPLDVFYLGVYGVDLPTYDLIFREVFVQISEDFDNVSSFRQVKDDLL